MFKNTYRKVFFGLYINENKGNNRKYQRNTKSLNISYSD